AVGAGRRYRLAVGRLGKQSQGEVLPSHAFRPPGDPKGRPRLGRNNGDSGSLPQHTFLTTLSSHTPRGLARNICAPFSCRCLGFFPVPSKISTVRLKPTCSCMWTTRCAPA